MKLQLDFRNFSVGDSACHRDSLLQSLLLSIERSKVGGSIDDLTVLLDKKGAAPCTSGQFKAYSRKREISVLSRVLVFHIAHRK